LIELSRTHHRFRPPAWETESIGELLAPQQESFSTQSATTGRSPIEGQGIFGNPIPTSESSMTTAMPSDCYGPI
jgi:hypothetical protein